MSMFSVTDDVRIEGLRPLIPPAILMEEIQPKRGFSGVEAGRREIEAVIEGRDPRLLVVVGPCSIHDPAAGLEYAERLRPIADRYADDLCITMRVYFEKPRTTVGWKGLINDPHLDGTFAINDGLRIARSFLCAVTDLGLKTACEFLDPISPQFLADLVSWGAIGARTSESQVHRELASGLSMPVGFKNGTDGNVQIAVDGVRSASHPHHFLSVTKQGLAAIVSTTGNSSCHIILRGGSDGPNYDAEAVEHASARMNSVGLEPRLMIDCSHANSRKDHRRQTEVADAIGHQVEAGNRAIRGVMIESFLVEGRQNHVPGEKLTFGQSITDACVDIPTTEGMLERLARATKTRRNRAFV